VNAVDMTASIVPRSDQLNAEDLLAGTRTVTITGVRRGGSAEQPVDIQLAEFDRPFKPCKTMRRVLVAAWGPDAATYVGRRMTIYRDPDVRFGGMDVGGIRISHLSHIAKRMTVALTVTRGRRAPYVIEPLAHDEQPTPQAAGYVEEICSPKTSLARLVEIKGEIERFQLGPHIVTGPDGSDIAVGRLLWQVGKEREEENKRLDIEEPS
jgi:hypothetical protein